MSESVAEENNQKQFKIKVGQNLCVNTRLKMPLPNRNLKLANLSVMSKFRNFICNQILLELKICIYLPIVIFVCI